MSLVKPNALRRTTNARVCGAMALLVCAACEAKTASMSPPLTPVSGSFAPPLAGFGGADAGSGGAGSIAGAPLGGAAGVMVEAGAGGTGGIGGGGMHGHMENRDHCIDGYLPDPMDALLTGEPDEWVASNGAIDLPLPAHVLAWMDERVWKQSHDAWHNVRRCNSFFPGFGGGDLCTEHPELAAEHQECDDAEDGYQFLVMHRHMMQGLMQAFPAHAALFEGFPTFPFEAQDVPEQWRDRFGNGWSAQIIDTANMLEDIENQLSMFPTEGNLGQFIQCGLGGNGMSSIHGAMHFKWVVSESPNSLGTQAVNVGNFMFWKLHGWIDRIWERYRIAKGLTPDEPKLVQALTDQCREMHTLGLMFDSTLPDDTGPTVPEYGFFHDNVRPILERYCAGCHEGSTPMAGLALAGSLSSADIVAQLVSVPAMRGGSFRRVAPGMTAQSWLYLKISDGAKSAGCIGTCNTQVMPPTGRVELTSAELALIEQWIVEGAPAPTATP